MTMGQVEYSATQAQLLLVGGIVADMQLEEFINAIGHAETVGPVLNPSLYLQTSQTVAHLKDMAWALLEFKRVVLKVREDVR